MSGAPKRLLEEGGHSTTSKRPHEENSPYSNLPGKSTPSFTNEYRLPFEAVSDGRMAKIPRLESRDVDSRHDRSFRLPSPANGSCLVLPGSESRIEVRDLKDSRDAKLEVRESKGEARELYTETRLDMQGSKIESDLRPDCRGDDKELRFERDFRSDVKYDIKYEKDSAMPATSHFNCKEQKEHPRSKRYSESSGDVLDPWRVPQHSLQAMDESDKPIRTGEGRESWEAHEAIGESKIELKGEDKNKEKDRKRKDEKYRDWGEREKDRNDRHSNLHPGSSNKESTREDRDTERWDRMRKDSHKIREGKERDKDPFKKPPSNVNEKEPLQILKDHTDNFVKTSEQENIALESKRTKEPEIWKGGERETKDRKKERDQDAEIERHDKQIRGSEKELVDGCAEEDGVTVREREMFCYGVQQGRRMMRQRGSSQLSSREPRPRARSRESEVSLEKAEVSSIVYKVGECMQEILKAWKEFQATNDNKRDAHLQNGPTLEIRIPAEHVTATNRQVRGGQLWGTDTYTDDSDLVAVLMHTGYCRPTASPPPSAIHELWATIRVLPPQDCYTSTLRNNVRSRAWGAGISCSFRVERCCIVKKGGGTIDLEPRLNHISAVEPTLAPVSIERTMTTRSAASNAMRHQKFVREVTIQYNLCNEPWLKYSISVVADKGLKKPMYTSARLKKGEVLYLETHFQRYELCFSGERIPSSGTATLASATLESSHGKTQHHIQNGDRDHERDHVVDLFRWSRCKKPLPQKLMRTIGIPLPTEHLEVLEDNIEWEDVQWSQTGVWIAGKEYVLARAHFLSSV